MTNTQSKEIRDAISQILVKWDMPTRQVAIGELLALVESAEQEAFQRGVESQRRIMLVPIEEAVKIRDVFWIEKAKGMMKEYPCPRGERLLMREQVQGYNIALKALIDSITKEK